MRGVRSRCVVMAYICVAMAFHSYLKRIYCVHAAYTPRIPIICHVSRFHSVLELIQQYGLNPQYICEGVQSFLNASLYCYGPLFLVSFQPMHCPSPPRLASLYYNWCLYNISSSPQSGNCPLCTSNLNKIHS